MDQLSTFLAMGGYAAFVWPAYGIAAAVLIFFALDSWRRVRSAAAALRRLEGPGAGDQMRKDRMPAQRNEAAR